jgi:nucleoid DNA-binding protein
MSTDGVEETLSFLLACGDDEELVLPGVGRLGTRRYEPYLGRNPRTGEVILVPATVSPFFRVAPGLVRALNGDEASSDEASNDEDVYDDNVDAAPKTVRTRFADALGERIRAKLVSGETVTIDELGTFEVVEKQGCNGVNPLTDEEVTIPARRVVLFRAAESLKTRLRDSTSA